EQISENSEELLRGFLSVTDGMPSQPLIHQQEISHSQRFVGRGQTSPSQSIQEKTSCNSICSQHSSQLKERSTTTKRPRNLPSSGSIGAGPLQSCYSLPTPNLCLAR